MASPTIEQNNKRSRPFSHIGERVVPLLPRRCAAWLLEASLITASALVPYSIGEYIRIYGQGETVPISPVLAQTRESISKTLALPPSPQSEAEVPPLTNLLWWTALLAPISISAWQLYQLGKTGQTLPKSWLGIQVIQPTGDVPGVGRAVVREGLGRYGLPLGTAYLIWRYAGAFPALGVLSGLAGLMLVIEGGMVLLGSRRRGWHDCLGKTYVVDAWQHLGEEIQQPYAVEVQSNWSTHVPQDGFTTIILTAHELEIPKFNLLRWMRQHPGTTIVSGVGVVVISVLGTFVGTQIYIQNQANYRDSTQQNNQVFLALVDQLSSPVLENLEERRAAILALARLNDPRAIPLLVDLLGQEENLPLMETLQQALVSSGVESLPYLHRLNRSLVNDIAALSGENSDEDGTLLESRLLTSQRAIAKLLTLHSGEIRSFDFDRTNLAGRSNQDPQFTLVLDRVDLAGNSFRGAILSNASLENSRFYGAGEDGRFGTFDDWISDLSGADFKEANLRGAILTLALIENTNLMGANLQQADLREAQLTGSNLSRANLVAANLTAAVLKNTSLTGANLTEANFYRANLQGGSLVKIEGAGANFSSGDLTQSNWQEANLFQSNFSDTNLREANLAATDLTGANLRNTDLRNADLRNANLSQADLRGANLAEANFQGVNFSQILAPSSDQFLAPAPQEASAAKIEGVDFSKVRNLNIRQVELICRQGGKHPQCS